jgi:hypothetical protein
MEIIESIAGRQFDYRTARGTYLSTADKKLAAKIISDVKQWWNNEQNISLRPGGEREGGMETTD